MSVRFTAYLSKEERQALQRAAADNSCSENYIVRMAVRHLLFASPIPTYLQPGVHDDKSSIVRR